MRTITEDFIKQLERGNVLGLDVASHCGYYTLNDYGTAYFPNNQSAPKKLGPDYGQHKAFRNWLMKLIERNNIKVIAAEDVVYGHFIDFRKLCEFRGVMLEVSETLDIPVVLFKPSDIKKHGTGNGNANKQMMINFAERRYKIEVGNDDNLADAIHIYMYFIHRYGL